MNLTNEQYEELCKNGQIPTDFNLPKDGFLDKIRTGREVSEEEFWNNYKLWHGAVQLFVERDMVDEKLDIIICTTGPYLSVAYWKHLIKNTEAVKKFAYFVPIPEELYDEANQIVPLRMDFERGYTIEDDQFKSEVMREAIGRFRELMKTKTPYVAYVAAQTFITIGYLIFRM